MFILSVSTVKEIQMPYNLPWQGGGEQASKRQQAPKIHALIVRVWQSQQCQEFAQNQAAPRLTSEQKYGRNQAALSLPPGHHNWLYQHRTELTVTVSKGCVLGTHKCLDWTESWEQGLETGSALLFLKLPHHGSSWKLSFNIGMEEGLNRQTASEGQIIVFLTLLFSASSCR